MTVLLNVIVLEVQFIMSTFAFNKIVTNDIFVKCYDNKT